MTNLSFDLSVDNTSVNDYLVDTMNCDFNLLDVFSSGMTFFLDVDNNYVIGYGDDVLLKLNIDSDFNFFGGFINGIVPSKDNFSIRYDVKSFGFKTTQTTYTGRFRADSGNGNMKTIIQNIIDEKFPDWSYDETSIPDIDIDFLVKNFQDERINNIFDTFAKRSDRIWFVDANKKFWFIDKSSFSTTTSSIIRGVNTVGNIFKDVDDSRFANIIKVSGASFDVNARDSFSCTGTAEEFTLSNFPSGGINVEYSSGTQVSTVLEGAEDYDDSTIYDAYFKPDVPSLQFNVNDVNGATLYVNYKFSSRIFEELVDATSIEAYNYERVKRIDDDNIKTQEEAYNIAKNELAENSYVVDVYTVSVFPRTQTELEDWTVGKIISFDDGDGALLNYTMSVSLSWSKSNGFKLSLVFNNGPSSQNFMISSLLKRINQLNDRDYSSGSSIIKTLYWSGNIVVDLENLSLETMSTDDDTFRMQDPELVPSPNWLSMMGGTAVMRDDYTTGTTKAIALSVNSSNFFRERFLDSFLIDESSNGTLDRDNNYWILGAGETLESREFAKGESTYDKMTLTVSLGVGGTSYSLWVKNESSDWTSASSGSSTSLGVKSDGLKYRILNTDVYDIYINLISGVYE